MPDCHQRCIYSISWSKAVDRIATAGADDALRILLLVRHDFSRYLNNISKVTNLWG